MHFLSVVSQLSPDLMTVEFDPQNKVGYCMHHFVLENSGLDNYELLTLPKSILSRKIRIFPSTWDVDIGIGWSEVELWGCECT